MQAVVRLVCAIFLVSFLVQPVNASAKDFITWYVMGYPPVFILDGQYKNQGIGDYLISRLIKEMPEFEHDIVEANLNRLLNALKTGEHGCFTACMRTPEREAFLYFSAYIWLPPVHLVINKNAAMKLGIDGSTPVSFADLLTNKELTSVFTTKRTFPGKVNELLVAHEEQPGNDNIWRIVMTPGSNWSPLKMVKNGRADYTVEYPWTAEFFMREANLSRDELVVAPFKEQVSGYPGFLACPRTEWGKARIREIDALIRRLAAEPAYRQAMNRWFNLSQNAPFSKASEEFYRKRAKSSWHTAED